MPKQFNKKSTKERRIKGEITIVHVSEDLKRGRTEAMKALMTSVAMEMAFEVPCRIFKLAYASLGLQNDDRRNQQERKKWGDYLVPFSQKSEEIIGDRKGCRVLLCYIRPWGDYGIRTVVFFKRSTHKNAPATSVFEISFSSDGLHKQSTRVSLRK